MSALPIGFSTIWPVGVDVTRGLDRRDQHDHDHQQDGHQRELRCAEVERPGEPDPVGVARAELGDSCRRTVADERRDHGADDQPGEHGDRGEEAACEPGDQQDHERW
jgi:hypothetical protein